MERIDIYNKALDLCGQMPIEEEDLTKEDKSSAVRTLDMWYDTSLRMVAREMRWGFLEQPVKLGDDIGPSHGYKHAYPILSDIESVTWVCSDRYSVIGNALCSDDEIQKAYGVMKDIITPDSKIPESFYDLVAISLAYHASVRLSPDQGTRASILALYVERRDALMLSVLQENYSEVQSYAD